MSGDVERASSEKLSYYFEMSYVDYTFLIGTLVWQAPTLFLAAKLLLALPLSTVSAMSAKSADTRFVLDDRFAGESEAESSKSQGSRYPDNVEEDHQLGSDAGGQHEEHDEEIVDGMFAEGFSGPSEKVVKPLAPEDLAKFKAAQEKTGVVYISRIPPGMRPTKVRHLMSQYGEVGRVYLQPEGV